MNFSSLPGNCTDWTTCIKLAVDKVLSEIEANRSNSSHERNEEGYYDDSTNSYKYIVFVLVVYAVSFLALMIKYFWRYIDKTNKAL